MAGTNDFTEKVTPEIDFNLSTLEEAAQRTNVIFPGIPIRFDRQDVNKYLAQVIRRIGFNHLRKIIIICRNVVLASLQPLCSMHRPIKT